MLARPDLPRTDGRVKPFPTRPLRAHQRAVSSLVAAIAAGEARGVSDILAAVTPGGGKSLLPVIAAARLMAAGVVERVCWVVPRDSLRLQAEEAFADPVWRRALGHDLAVRAAENEPDPSRGCAGYVTTYQAIAAAPDLHLSEIRRRRTLLVVDEVHHLPALSAGEPASAAGDGP
jgi:superfamily II DNA or RNA helicase